MPYSKEYFSIDVDDIMSSFGDEHFRAGFQ